MPIRDPAFHLGRHISLSLRGVLGLLVGLFCVGLGIVRWDAVVIAFGLGVLAFFAAIGTVFAALEHAREAADMRKAEEGVLGSSDGDEAA